MEYISNTLGNLVEQTAFMNLTFGNLIMIAVACVFLYLAIRHEFEPLLLVPIAFGMLLVNIYPDIMLHAEDAANGTGGLLYYFYQLDEWSILPSLIFLGVGAMTDFGPLIANPKSFLLGAAAQFGIFAAYLGAMALGFSDKAAAAISIIGGADGPTSIFLAGKLQQTAIMGPIAVAAYSYMSLVPIIQPMAIKAVTTKKERMIRMPYEPGKVSRFTRIAFPIIVTFVAGLVAPASVALVGFLMFGNLIRECGVLGTMSDTAQNILANLITLLLGITISFSMRAEQFVTKETLLILVIGLFAFVMDTIGGVLLAKFMNLFLKKKINPMIGGAGISAFPMSSRVVQKMAMEEDPTNVILMQAAGANVSGQIASVIAGGMVINLVTKFL